MGLKRIITVVLLVTVALVLTGCMSRTDTAEKMEKYAQLVMPDGTIVEGKYTEVQRLSNGWVYIDIDGTTYWINSWRIALWEGR